MILTNDQEGALLEIKSFLLDPSKKEHILSGNSGSGKSTLVRYVLSNLTEFLKPTKLLLGEALVLTPHLTATTNEAATVLSNSTGTEVLTVHKQFKLRFQNNYSTGKKELITKDCNYFENAFIIVDEASMCNTIIRSVILENTCKNSKILYVGDNQQLDAVNSICNIFTSGLSDSHLTTNVRQAGNEIAALGLRFRDAVLSGVMPTLDYISTDYVKYIDGSELQELIKERFNKDSFDSTRRILAYSNERVIEYNNYIRELQNGCAGFKDGEILTTNNTITSNNNVIAKNNTDVTISNIKYCDHHGMKGYKMTASQMNKSISGFVPDDKKLAKKAINAFAKNKDWKNMFGLQDSILDLRPRFSSTVHKAQGGTLDEVYIDLDDIGSEYGTTKSKARALYVAITRAKNKVYFYGSL
jgi:ATP-dependent exoDNAse (exonuclease V) alpha subunit